MLDIQWLQPATIEEALQMAAHYGEAARLVAGGTWVTLVMRQRLLMPEALVSLRRLSSLRHIGIDEHGALHLGALVTHRQVERSPVVRAGWPVLAETFASVANVRVRNQATVGGVLCDADYASDPPSTLVALGAEVVLRSLQGERRLPVRDFILDHYTTAISPEELLTEVVVPPLAPGARAVYLKYRTRSHEDRPCVGVAALARPDPEGRCADLRVVIGAVAGTPQVVDEALAAAIGRRLDRDLAREIAQAYAGTIDPLADLRGSSWYRRQMIRVHVERALREIGE